MSLDHCHRYLDGDLNVLLAEVGDVHVDDNPPPLLLRTLITPLLTSLYAPHLMATACLKRPALNLNTKLWSCLKRTDCGGDVCTTVSEARLVVECRCGYTLLSTQLN